MKKFTNITLASGKSAAEPEQGLKRLEAYYVTGSSYGIGTAADDTTVNTDYYVVWNLWPTMSGVDTNYTNDVSITPLSSIGINTLTVRAKNGAVVTAGSSALDCVIIRREDKKAVHLIIEGETAANYRDGIKASYIAATTEIIELDQAIDGPWTPELARLATLGYL